MNAFELPRDKSLGALFADAGISGELVNGNSQESGYLANIEPLDHHIEERNGWELSIAVIGADGEPEQVTLETFDGKVLTIIGASWHSDGEHHLIEVSVRIDERESTFPVSWIQANVVLEEPIIMVHPVMSRTPSPASRIRQWLASHL